MRRPVKIAFSPGDAEWPSFTAFQAFRRRLGLDLDRRQGF